MTSRDVEDKKRFFVPLPYLIKLINYRIEKQDPTDWKTEPKLLNLIPSKLSFWTATGCLQDSVYSGT